MLACYLDDSDAGTSSVITIAGYFAEASAWAAFEVEAESLCAAFGVDVLHGREFDGRRGCFKGWSVPRSADFLIQLGDIMGGNLLAGLSRSVVKDIYKRNRSAAMLSENLSAYGFAFGTICFSLGTGNEFGLAEKVKSEGVSYFVESGHRNNPNIERYVASETAHGNLNSATSVTFIDKRSCRAIQIADLYAFYSRKRANRAYKTKQKIAFFPDTYQLHVQDRLPHRTGLIEQPAHTATNTRTGETFNVIGLVSEL